VSVLLINNSSTIKKDDAMLKSFFLIFICLSLLAGCSTDEPVSSNLLQEETPTLNKPTTSPVYTFPDPPAVVVVGASSKIVRNNNGVTVTVNTSGLVPGSAVTIWLVIFNNPEECFEGCNIDDLGNPDVEADVIYGAGHVVGPNGTANFAAHLNEGDTGGSLFPQPSPGLIDAETAEIHIIVRSHGPFDPGRIPEQIHTVEGDCDETVCVDLQFAIFQP
jgi:hypothetical protein